MASKPNLSLAENVSTSLTKFSCGGPHQGDSSKIYVYDLTSEFNGALIFLSIFNFVICVPTALSNLGVILSFTGNRSLRINSNRLLFSLCIADLLVGVLVEPIMGSHLLFISVGHHDCALSNFLVFTVPVLIVVTMATHAGISAERYAAIHYQQFYSRYFTKRNITIFMVLIWIICSSSYIIAFLSGNPVTGTKIAVGFILVSLLISAWSYISVYRDSSYRHRKHKYHVQGAFIIRETIEKERTPEEMSQFRKDVRLAAFYFKLYACMLTFYLLNLIKNAINSYDTLSQNAHHLFHYFLDTLLFMNALVNPILILALSSEIRMGIMKVFKR